MRFILQRYLLRAVTFSLLLVLSALVAAAQTTSFTYQGRLTDGGTAATGNYDLQFALFDAVSGGVQVGATQGKPNIAVSAGIFTVTLDFGASAFPGANRWLEISTRLTGSPAFTTLAPRQQISSTPYALRSLNASSADSVTVNGVPSGSGNYIQNTNTLQANSNFNISGTGRVGGFFSANGVNVTSQYYIGNVPVLSTPFNSNLFVGYGAGEATTQGNGTGGYNNSFFGYGAGVNHTIGGNNSLFGNGSGFNLTTGTDNTIIGVYADVGSNPLRNATAIGARARVDQSDSMVLGSIAGVNSETVTIKVGIGTTTPQNTLHVKGGTILEAGGSGGLIQFGTPSGETGMTIIKGTSSRFDMRFDGSALKLVAGAGNPVGVPAATSGIAITTAGTVGIGTTTPFINTKLDIVGGFLRLDQLAGGGDEQLCRNSAVHTIATCSSSLRYKEQLAPYRFGLALISRLNPISFSWKSNHKRDLGLGAEDVAKVEPLLVTYNDKGEVEGVKYDRINLVLINSIKEQQQQIEKQRQQLEELKTEVGRLRALVRRRGRR